MNCARCEGLMFKNVYGTFFCSLCDKPVPPKKAKVADVVELIEKNRKQFDLGKEDNFNWE